LDENSKKIKRRYFPGFKDIGQIKESILDREKNMPLLSNMGESYAKKSQHKAT